MSEAKLLSPEDLEAGFGFAARQYPGAAKSIRDHIAALEADNAALLQVLKDTAGRLTRYNHAEDCAVGDESDWEDTDGCVCILSTRPAIVAVAERTRPGAALLEEHRKALEPLQGVAAALAEEMERAVEAKERPKGGQQVPFHGDFASFPPSMVGRLRWWARELRTALGGAHGKALVRARNEGLERAALRLLEQRDKPVVRLNKGRAGGLEEAASIIRALMEPEE